MQPVKNQTVVRYGFARAMALISDIRSLLAGG